jgi:hypothetical protein
VGAGLVGRGGARSDCDRRRCRGLGGGRRRRLGSGGQVGEPALRQEGDRLRHLRAAPPAGVERLLGDGLDGRSREANVQLTGTVALQFQERSALGISRQRRTLAEALIECPLELRLRGTIDPLGHARPWSGGAFRCRDRCHQES